MVYEYLNSELVLFFMSIEKHYNDNDICHGVLWLHFIPMKQKDASGFRFSTAV